MPVQHNQTALYNDLDEVLNKPPKKMVHYGNILLLLVILMVCCISFIVKHEDSIECQGTILPGNFMILQSPQTKTTVKKMFLQHDTLLHKGDTVIVLKKDEDSLTANAAVPNEIAIVTPYDCKVVLKRMPQQGEILSPGTALAGITGAQSRFDVQLEIPATYIEKIKLGLEVKINNIFFPGRLYGVSLCKIISTPYFDTTSKKMIADARLEFTAGNNGVPKPVYIFRQTIAASIVSGKKSLAEGFIEFN